MKYLESYKSNKLNKINLNSEIVDIINKFIPGQYMIFTYNECNFKNLESGDVLYLCKIGHIKHVKENDRHNYNVFDKQYLNVKIFDFIPEIELTFIPLGTKEFNIDNNNFKQIIFTSNSLEKAQNKFNELKEEYPYSDWIINQNIRKFNI